MSLLVLAVLTPLNPETLQWQQQRRQPRESVKTAATKATEDGAWPWGSGRVFRLVRAAVEEARSARDEGMEEVRPGRQAREGREEHAGTATAVGTCVTAAATPRVVLRIRPALDTLRAVFSTHGSRLRRHRWATPPVLLPT